MSKRRYSKNAAVLATALLFLAFLSLSACGEAPKVTPTAAATRPLPTPTPSKTPEPVVIRPTGPPPVQVTAPLPGIQALESEHFDFYVKDGYRPVDLAAFSDTAEAIYDEVIGRMAAGSPQRIILSFQQPDDVPCAARGWTFVDDIGPRMTIFVNDQTEDIQIRGVLAHELAHVFHITGYERELAGERNLTEGLATWITRDYWTAWKQTGSLDEMVRGYLTTGEYIPLEDADVFSAYPRQDVRPPDDCQALRDQLYTQWAAFTGYLLEEYGWAAFEELMASAAPEIKDNGEVLVHPADYLGVYDKGLEELEGEWLSTLTG